MSRYSGFIQYLNRQLQHFSERYKYHLAVFLTLSSFSFLSEFGVGNIYTQLLFIGLFVSSIVFFPFIALSLLLIGSRNYYFETLLSLLPYVLITILIAVVCLIILRPSKIFAITIKPIRQIRVLVLIFMLGFLYWIFPYASQISPKETSSTNEGTRVLYSNILHSNNQYDQIIQTIKKLDPDIIIFSEYGDHHFNKLKLEDTYPFYIQRPPNEEGQYGSRLILYSRLPISQARIQHNLVRARVVTPSGSLNIYGVHLTSPSNLYNFNKRNIQIDAISSQLASQPKDEPTLFMGDFNTVPASPYFAELEHNLAPHVIPRFIYHKPYFTWQSSLNIIKAHLDHIFVSPNLVLYEQEVINIPGSDHEGLLLSL